ncbi:MAG: alanine racemase [Eubacterium sp.]|nr:alanine racemase [Eubacterium sp.]
MSFDFAAISEMTGSPSYVFSESKFKERASLVKEAFGEKADLCFSIKANPFLLSVLPDTFAKIEVCSPGELEICKALSMDPDMIIFSGVNKSLDEVREAIRYGAGVLTIESIQHFEWITQAAKEASKTVDVLIRLTAGSQFGMSEEELLSIIRSRETHPEIRIRGIHFFSGTQKRKPKEIQKELAMLSEFIDRVLADEKFEIERIEYGTGLSVDYFRNDADESEQERLMAIAPDIRALGEKAHLTVEMGRFFAAPCGYYISKVIDAKTNEEINYAVLDGGLHQLKYDGQLQGMQVPVITHISDGVVCEEKKEDKEAWTLCGSLCTTADVIARNAMFCDLKIGDLLVFHRTGAYSVMEGMSVFLSRDMPKVWLLKENGDLCLLRDRIDTWRMNLPSL